MGSISGGFLAMAKPCIQAEKVQMGNGKLFFDVGADRKLSIDVKSVIFESSSPLYISDSMGVFMEKRTGDTSKHFITGSFKCIPTLYTSPQPTPPKKMLCEGEGGLGFKDIYRSIKKFLGITKKD